MKKRFPLASRIKWILLFSILIISGCSQGLSNSSTSIFKEYKNQNWGISFEYPSTMEFEEFNDSRVEDNIKLSLLATQFRDKNVITEIFLQIIDDPYLSNQADWYPPSEIKLQLFSANELGNLNVDNLDENNNAVKGALEAATYKSISGFPSIQYRVFLTGSYYGYIYVRGAEIITPKRSYSLQVIGGLSEAGAEHDTVNAEKVDDIWEKLISTILIDE